MRLLRVVAALLALGLVLACVGCHKKSGAEASAGAASAVPSVTDATTGMLFTWIDDKGEFHVEERVADVPAAARDLVRVTDPAREAPSGEIFVADLRNARPDGTYAVHAAPRASFEDVAVSRRKAHGAVLAEAPPAATGSALLPGPVAAEPDVIIYGASWCGPCHQAQSYFRTKGVPFVEKDIERDHGAAREMQAKLARAGMRGGSIPVIDVRGRLLVGFDAAAIDRALAAPL